jgi:arsenate reductase
VYGQHGPQPDGRGLFKKIRRRPLRRLQRRLSTQEINPATRQVMAEKGFDLSGQYSKGPGEFLGKMPIRYLIIVCGNAEKTCPRTFPGVLFRFFWPFDDPATAAGSDEEKLDKFRQVRDQIDQRIQAWLQEKP